MRIIRAVVMALMIFGLFANMAAADDGGIGVDVVPYDPGLPSEVVPAPPAPFTE